MVNILLAFILIIGTADLLVAKELCNANKRETQEPSDIENKNLLENSIMTDIKAVPAAPNLSWIKARVQSVTQDKTFSDKWHVTFEILESKNIHGPNFAETKHSANGFYFGESSALKPGNIMEAKAEFRGDERGGIFQLHDIQVLQNH
jgi:hypothetical protein